MELMHGYDKTLNEVFFDFRYIITNFYVTNDPHQIKSSPNCSKIIKRFVDYNVVIIFSRRIDSYFESYD